MAVPIYRPDEINVSFLGNTIKGFGGDTFLNVEYAEDTVKLNRGISGSIFTIEPQIHVNITLSILQDDPDAALLDSIFRDKLQGMFRVTRIGIDTLVEVPFAMVAAPAPLGFNSTQATNREFSIIGVPNNNFSGGFAVQP